MAGPRKVLHAVAQPRPPQNYKVSVGEECQVLRRSWSCGLIVLPSKTALGARWKGWLGLEAGTVQENLKASLLSENHSALAEAFPALEQGSVAMPAILLWARVSSGC